MTDFPMEAIVDILLRLPVKPLLRFRCVSKHFCALIDSHDFIRSHLKQSIKTKIHLSLLLATSSSQSVYFDSLDSHPFSLQSVYFDSLDRSVELNHPFSADSVTKVWGSCDGLVCLGLGDSKGDLAIWNPSTRSSQKLPSIKNDLFPCKETTYGFGYDSLSDDYKVVRFVQTFRDSCFASVVKVYSMKSNSWRSIQDFPYYFGNYQRCGVLIGCALHWVVIRPESDTVKDVVAFDLTTEDYQLVPLPEFRDDIDKDFRIVELGGCLCIISRYGQVRNDVWVMKDYGVQESWSKLFSVELPPAKSFTLVIPVAYSKSGSEVLFVQDNTELVWYDLDHKKIKEIMTRGINRFHELFVCVESLVPVKTCANRQISM